MLLYKYKNLADIQSFNYALDSLRNKYFYFSRPSEVNDPFDCRIQPDYKATDKEYLQWIKENKKRLPANNRLLTVDGIKKVINENRTIEGIEKMANDIVETNHLFSLSSDCLNESMWALYAGNYNGICIGYKFVELRFIPSKIVFIDSKTGNTFEKSYYNFIPFEKIEYDNDGSHHLNFFTDDEKTRLQNVVYNLEHKKECWKNEKEYRGIFHTHDLGMMQNPNIITKIYYEDNILYEIIFGYQVPSETREMIIQIIKNNYNTNVKFYIIDTDLDKYALVKKEIL